ncbi:anaphase-promoting complex subunit 6 [Nematocida minor]|uniref:anaphase-promoting complex subunit 6 n=1 Tax=Nematocida minor TaxID=1912983 RepID=UPI0022200A89|nr:anaphase-promoting complex subunit 6 [Nematocida minor]KAI5189665.1 anaphase-promoting complex subunit 6 [Nematocida minor]
MDMDLLFACREAYFEESTILLAEYVFKQNQTPENFLILLTSLVATSKHEAVKWLVNRRREYFRYGEVQRLYIEAMKRLGEISEIDQFQMTDEKIPRTHKTSWTPISPASLNSYYQALVQKGSEKKRRECLEAAIKHDERNLEAYIYVGMNKSFSELPGYIDAIKDSELKTLFGQILTEPRGNFSLFSRSFYSPFSCCRIAKRLFNDRQTSEIFQIAQYMAAVYPSHYFTYVATGMYYILVGKHSDAKRSLFKALQLNNTFGMGWILLGYCQAFLCEGGNAISCYEKAEVLMEENYTPSLGIALEYHRMRSYKKAEKKYLEIQSRYGLDFCFNAYVSLLVVQERHEEALSLVQGREYSGEKALLKSVCHLFMNDPVKAEDALTSINISYHSQTRSKYYLLLGYIRHINKNYCDAIELYQRAILDPGKPVGSLVNDLLELAIKNSLEEDNKKLITQYREDVFDFLDLKSDLPLVL